MKKLVFLSLILCLLATPALASKVRPGKHSTPPPMAFKACKGLSEGDTASFIIKSGQELSGSCVERGGKLVLHPNMIRGKVRLPDTKE